MQQNGHLAKRQQPRHVGEVAGPLGDGLLDEIQSGEAQDRDRGAGGPPRAAESDIGPGDPAHRPMRVLEDHGMAQ